MAKPNYNETDLEYFRDMVRKAVKAGGRYSKAMEPQIYAAASSLRAMALANRDIDGLWSTVIDTPQGLKGHPAFRVRKEAEESLIRHLKALGLSSGDLDYEVEDDKLVEATKKVIAAGKKKPVIIKPDFEDEELV